MNKLERLQRKATRTIRKTENITSVVPLKELGSINVKNRKLRNMIFLFRYRLSQSRRKKIKFIVSNVYNTRNTEITESVNEKTF